MADKSTGVLLSRGAEPIGKITSINGMSITTDAIDVTDLDAVAKLFIPGPYDGGEITLEILFEADNSDHVFFTTDQLAGTISTWTITFTDAGNATWAASAFVTSNTPTASVGAAVTASITLKITGEISITP